MAKNNNLHNAKRAKNDEFYTTRTSVERELCNYRDHFKGKVVYCNCDDPIESEFYHYFSYKFEDLGLKKLISTGYKEDGHGVAYIYEGDKNGNRIPNIEEIERYPLKGSGDFRSEECIEFLKEADIVVTNPPFSLFREYVAQLVEYGKEFLIVGNSNAITYKEIFPLIKENKLWLGVSLNATKCSFIVNEDYDGKNVFYNNGVKYAKVNNAVWFTNLDHKKRHEELLLYKKYNEEEYPKYDNYDAIEVSKVTDIPMDYEGIMGVPITFLNKYCPTQFEIVKFRKGDDGKDLCVNGKCPYFRILIKRIS